MITTTPQLVIMVGLPRSGKTTIVNQVYLQKGYAVVCPDVIRLCLYGERFNSHLEPMVWGIVFVMVSSLLKSGNNVVLDGTFTTRRRREVYKIFDPRFHIVNTLKDECIARARKLNDEYIIPVIERMAEQFEPLEADEREI